MDQALSVEVGVLFVDLSEQFLDPDVLFLLHTCLHLRVVGLKVYLEDLIGNWEFPDTLCVGAVVSNFVLSWTLANMGMWRVHVKSAVMSIR